MTRPSVVVVGGGIAGLSAAWELTGGESGPSESTPRVEVIEASPQLGGSLRTTSFAGTTIDLGPDGFLARRPEATTLIRELGCESELEAIDATGAWIFLRGRLEPIPEGLALGIPTTSAQVRSLQGLTWRSRLSLLRDRLAPRRLAIGDDVSIGEIIRTKLGHELAFQLIEPMLGGIQAGRIDELSARAVFPALFDAAHEGGSLTKSLRSLTGAASPGPRADATPGPSFMSLRSGLGSLPRVMAERLEERGVVFRLASPVERIRRDADYPLAVDTANATTPAHAVIVTTPPRVSATLIEPLAAGVGELANVRSASAAMVTVDLDPHAVTLPPSGTGVLVPLGTPWGDESMMVTALTFLDRKWPHLRDERVLIRAHVGRIDDERWTHLDDEALAGRVIEEIGRLVRLTGTPRHWIVQRWPSALPQYEVGHLGLVERVRGAAQSVGVEVAGMTYDGVGVPASIGSGRRAARNVLERLA